MVKGVQTVNAVGTALNQTVGTVGTTLHDAVEDALGILNQPAALQASLRTFRVWRAAARERRR